ncbi:MAG: DUF2800 domain-containing protein [Clostridiales bacterium]|nr:DUF2800 domain-containing protein [Clostridiales bacterium]
MPSPEQHALLSASSAHRWLNCPGSARLAEQFPNRTSPYAEAGRVAHAIAELKARKYFLEPMSARTYNAQLKKLRDSPHFDKSMDENTDTYLEVLKETALSFEKAPFVALETRVDFSDSVPEGFGTADCIMIGSGTIVIIDYKNGAGVPVEAEDNSQMKLYALGALQVYAPIYGDTIQRAVLKIVQPNAGGTKTWETTVQALKLWAFNTVKPIARIAYDGKGGFSAGDWCGFCPAKAQCSARARQMLEMEPMVGAKPQRSSAPEGPGKNAPALLSDAEVGDILRRAQTLAAWVEDLKEYALSAALAGREITGFKVVEGRGSREWNNQDAAFQALQQRGVAEELLWERKPCSVAGLEKALGKKVFSEAAEGLVVKKPGKPALVPASDKRPPYNAAAIAFGGK